MLRLRVLVIITFRPIYDWFTEDFTKRGFALKSESWINRLGAALITFALTVGASVSTLHAVGDARKGERGVLWTFWRSGRV